MYNLYQAKRNADLTEGRGPMVVIGTFTKEEDAKKAAKGWGVMGFGDGEVDTLTVFDTFEEFAAEKAQKTRQTALSKLTRAERMELGLE